MSIEPDEVQSKEIIIASSSKRRRTTSKCWDFYDELPLNYDPDNRLRAECKKCKKVFLA